LVAGTSTSALKMETVCFSEVLVYTYECRRRHHPREQHRQHYPCRWL
jgi:hypothetical protein